MTPEEHKELLDIVYDIRVARIAMDSEKVKEALDSLDNWCRKIEESQEMLDQLVAESQELGLYD